MHSPKNNSNTLIMRTTAALRRCPLWFHALTQQDNISQQPEFSRFLLLWHPRHFRESSICHQLIAQCRYDHYFYCIFTALECSSTIRRPIHVIDRIIFPVNIEMDTLAANIRKGKRSGVYCNTSRQGDRVLIYADSRCFRAKKFSPWFQRNRINFHTALARCG